ncbi:hypothetical protein BE15_04180 [Sorangium cellulosum]|uniref:Cytochrome c domain-containing protein n=2 Tax=Polyangiaceae TaxID=49 RepID=A0A150Q8D6_SORCE|nr:hypothetical protein BE15_04180 [Sorangium cellulosum]
MRYNNLQHASATDRRTSRRRLATLVALTALSLSACGGEGDNSSGSAPDGTGGAPDVSSGSGGSSPISGPSSSSSSGSASSSHAASGSGGGDSTMHPYDHCVNGYMPHPSDSSPTMKDGPAEFFPPGNTDPNIVDLTVQPEVLQWMYDNSWQAAHVEWHAIRACNLPGGGGLSKVNICKFTQLVPEDQNCQSAGDGYQFLVFHRHMIQALKQLWPNHSEQFTGFTKFPTSAEDVPPQWRSAWKDWDASALEAGRIGDEIDKPENLARFPDEGTLGFWLQCNVGQRLRMPANNMPWVGLHFVLHAKWARPGNTKHGVNNTEANIDNYMFWKLHGWIDNVWEKYRLAKGLKPDDQKLKDDLVAQCREMDTEIKIIQEDLTPDEVVNPNEPLPVESGFFHERVRPLFEDTTNLCSGCHAESGANARLTLGGHISSKKIVEGLVNRPSLDGGQYKLVVPGDPDHSWLYLKAAGLAAGAGCTPTATAQCIDGVMPPSTTGPTMTQQQLGILRQWIQDGAAGPP